MSNKAISELVPHEGKITGKEILIISNVNEDGLLESQQYNLMNFKDEVSSEIFDIVSNDVSILTSLLSSEVSNLTGEVSSNLSVALSVLEDATYALSNLSSKVSSFYNQVSTRVSSDLSGFERNVSSDLSTYVDTVIVPLQTIMALSTLDYYTLIGDKVCCDTFIEQAASRGPEALSAAYKVLWFDTTDDPRFHPLENIRRMDNLQVQIYRLGLQLQDVHKILENGVIPGDAYNTTKDEMIKFADLVLPPDESQVDGELLGMSIYGNYYCKNGQLYYLLFNPSGYLPKEVSFDWIIEDHDAGISTQKTMTSISNDIRYSLRATLDDEILSSTAKIILSAAIYNNGEVPTFVSDLISVDEVIKHLSADDNLTMSFFVSSDNFDDTFKEYIVSDPFEVSFKEGTASKLSSSISIVGNDYIDGSTLYYCMLDESDKKFPLNVNTNWYFLSSFYIDVGSDKELSVVKSSLFKRKFFPDEDDTTRVAEVTMSLLHFEGTPICQVSVELSNCTEIEAKDVSSTIYVESNYDHSLSASKDILGIGGLEPATSLMEPTVKAVCAKFDTKANLVEKTLTMHQGELVYFSDTNLLAVYNGTKFMILNSSSSSGLSKEEIQDIGLEYLTFSPTANSLILNKVITTPDGDLHILQKNKYDSASDYTYDNSSVGKVWVSHWLQIGKIYAGGKSLAFNDVVSNNKDPESLVSHNFIELTNASDRDINLDKIYLMYHTTDTNFKPDLTLSGNSQWEFLKLEGVIKAHGTYLIRGARCNPCKNIMIDVDKCDLEWRKRTSTDVDVLEGNYTKFTRSGDLIEFSLNAGSFFLCYATNNSDGTGNGNNIKAVALGTTPLDMIENNNTKGGYIDLVGIGTKSNCSYYENAPFSSPSGTFNNKLVHKWYYMEPAKQGNKVLYSVEDGKNKFRSNATLMTCINLEKLQVVYRDSSGKRDKFYYNDEYKKLFKPGTTYDNNGIFATKTHFVKLHPNMLNVTFGIQATHDTSKDVKASRCFNWISLGYYDEYVEVRKVGASSSDPFYSWVKFYSITPEDSADYIEPFHQFYNRIRWTASDGNLATTHKVIIKNLLTYGTYEYRVGRDEDQTYCSEIKTFTVRRNSDVQSFSFIQTSDLQGFNWIEYQAWKAACKAISLNETNFDFTINTGDIAQSGNRVSEWIDYDDGRKPFADKEEMFTIGNNDLCGSPSHILGDGEDNTSKFNLINILYYYTFELDPNNQCYSTFEGNLYPLYSLYSFNYGPWHFISLVSEIRSYYAKAFPELASQSSKYALFAKTLNASVEDWFKRDLQNYMDEFHVSDCSKCIVYMHEMPFTMVTPDFFDLNDSYWGSAGRTTASTGSKLNLENNYGNYRFSRLFKKAGIRLVIGGHKHTFTLSNPLYDASEDYLVPDSSKPLTSDVSAEDPFISSPVSPLLSHKPIIEMPIDGVAAFVDYKVKELSNSLPAAYATYVNGLTSLNSTLLSSVSSEGAFVTALNNIFSYTRSEELPKKAFENIDVAGSSLSSFLRIKFVKKITAPTLAMSLATGYKVVSNKELPSATSDNDGICRYTPWLLSYCAANSSTKTSSGKSGGNFTSEKNPVQCRPTYIRYDFDSENISVAIKQVDGIYNILTDGKYATYTLDTQETKLSCNPVTFGAFGKSIGSSSAGKYFIPTTSDDYMRIYSDYINNDTYIIKL